MPESQADPKIFTLEEANAILPQVRLGLASLRRHVTQVLAQEAHVDAMELVDDAAAAPATTKVAQELALLEQQKSELQQAFEAFERLGCHLKDLDIGLIDFYTWMDGELVLLCWHEEEDRIRFWHTVQDGYAGRQSIPGT